MTRPDDIRALERAREILRTETVRLHDAIDALERENPVLLASAITLLVRQKNEVLKEFCLASIRLREARAGREAVLTDEARSGWLRAWIRQEVRA